jgi:integrase
MTPQDMVDLKASEVDWRKMTISRVRSKMQKSEKGILVTYVLWDRTFGLLHKYGERNGLVITKSKSTIQAALRRHRDKIRMEEEIGYGTLKKTSGTLIAHKFDSDTNNLFLGHSPRGTTKRHYEAADQEKLNEAVRWLEGQCFAVGT